MKETLYFVCMLWHGRVIPGIAKRYLCDVDMLDESLHIISPVRIWYEENKCISWVNALKTGIQITVEKP